MKRLSTFAAAVLLLLLASNCSRDEPIVPVEEPEAEMYTLNITYDGVIPIDDKIDMTLYARVGALDDTLLGSIKRRGGFSISFPKHSYEIDLKTDASLAGLPADDDWIVNANYIDKTFLRHVVSYELFREMHANNRASGTNFIEVQLNGLYNGLYVLMEKLDKSTLGIDENDAQAVIFKEPHLFRSTYDQVVPQDPANFHQQTYPEIEDDDRTAFIETTRAFVLNGDSAVFAQQAGAVFDLQNMVDWHLLLLISNNSDGILKNFYLYKIDAQTPLRIAPWDYDHSFGRDGDNELNLDTRPLDINRSILFSRLLTCDWYRQRLKARWTELNDRNLLSVSGLKARITARAATIAQRAERNFGLWPVDGAPYYDANDFEQEIQVMHQFIDLRHERLRLYFAEL